MKIVDAKIDPSKKLKSKILNSEEIEIEKINAKKVTKLFLKLTKFSFSIKYKSDPSKIKFISINR